MKEFKNLSKKERKERIKEAKKEIFSLYKARKAAPTAESRKWLRLTLIFLAAAVGLAIIGALVSVPFIGILSGIVGLGAAIFFVLWLINMAGTV
jgi:Flp pilus assembly protein TadB